MKVLVSDANEFDKYPAKLSHSQQLFRRFRIGDNHLKSLILFPAITLVITSLLLTVGCERTVNQKFDDEKVDLKQVVDPLKKAEADARHAVRLDWLRLRKESNAKSKATEKMIFEYRLKMVDSKGKFRSGYNTNVDVLEKKNKELRTKLLDFKDDGGNSWELFKTGFNYDMDELSANLKAFSLNNK